MAIVNQAKECHLASAEDLTNIGSRLYGFLNIPPP